MYPLRLRTALARSVQLAACLLAPSLWVSLSAAFAQVAPVQRQPSGGNLPRHSVSGTVVNAVRGEPIARAVVELAGQQQANTMTDANGTFRFEGIAEGAVTLSAERPGFFTQLGPSASQQGSPMIVRVASDVDSVALKLVPQALIAGRVNSIRGVPIEDFPVRIYRRNLAEGRLQWQLAGSATTDDEGQFRVAGLMPGSYCLSAGPENWRPRAPGARQLGYPQVFYPNAPDFSGASIISLTAGQQVEADFSLTQEPLFQVSGQVVGIPPTIYNTVQLTSSSGEPIPLVQTHPERHEFSGYAAAGRYTLKASAQDENNSFRAAVPLNVASNLTGLQIVLGPQASIPVNVRAESAGPAGVSLSREQAVLNVTVRLISTTPGLNPVEFWARRAFAKNQLNNLEFLDVEPGTYAVEINAYTAYVVSATSGSTNLLHGDLVVPADGRADPIEIVLGSDGGEIGGTVQLPDHESSATILLVPERGSTREIKTATTQGAGEFRFDQVRPGDYVLLAFDRVEDLEYKNPDVLGNFMSNAMHISVAPRQQMKATLDLIETGK